MVTHFSRKIHLQEDEVLMTPPRIGPNKRESTKTTETMLVYKANFAGGINSKNMTMHTEYMPEPPMPWKARKTILIHIRANDQGARKLNSKYSCVVVCDAPQAPENRTKITTDVITVSFRPKISLNFDQMIRKPISKSITMKEVFVEGFQCFTNICQ